MTNADMAAWVSAFGGVGSVGAAIYIAVHQTRRANTLERQATDSECVRRGFLIDEAQRIAKQIVELHDQCTARTRPLDTLISGWTEAYDAYKQAIDVECDRLMALQRFAVANLAIYATIERIARTSRLEPRSVHTSQGSAGMTSFRIAEQTTKLAEELDRYR